SATALASMPPSRAVLRDGGLERTDNGTERRQSRPSLRQSNSALPPSCDSMLAITLRVPKPRDVGSATCGPPLSSQVRRSEPVSFSQFTASRPERVDSAPYFAELVTSSCSASASVCAV